MKQANSLIIILCLVLAVSISYAGTAQDKVEEDPELVDLIHDYSKKAYDYFKININLDSAEFYYKKAIDLALSSSNYYVDHRVANNYNSLASLYSDIYQNAGALECYNEAEKILNRTDPKNILFGSVYHNKGTIYSAQSDFFRTREYYEFALDFYTRNGYQDSYNFSFVYSNYIKLLLALEEFELAEEKLSIIDFSNLNVRSIIEFRIYITNASLYSQLGKYDLAKRQFQEAKKSIETQPGFKDYTSDILNYYYDIIEFQVTYKEYDQALIVCDNALIFFESLDPRATTSKFGYRGDISLRSA